MTVSERPAALVTGSADLGGIGAGIARRLARRGYALVLMDLDPAVVITAGAVERETGVPAGTVLPWIGDVTDPASIDAAFEQIVTRFGRIDAVIANAGGGGTEVQLVDLDVSEFDRIVALNLRGTFLTCRAAGRIMREAGRGSIVTIGSIYAQEPAALTAPYAAAKAAIIAMTQVMARELGPYGVRVNSVAPGYIVTPSLVRAQENRAARAGLDLEEERRRVDAMVPLGRHGNPSDIASAVDFLVSDESAYVTGHTLGVTGGVVMR